jgi:hypothetical protein
MMFPNQVEQTFMLPQQQFGFGFPPQMQHLGYPMNQNIGVPLPAFRK